MNRKELVEMIANKLGKPKVLINEILGSTLDTIIKQVGAGETIRLVGFGTFQPVSRGIRVARNPKTNEVIEIPPRIIPKFKASKNFKVSVVNLNQDR